MDCPVCDHPKPHKHGKTSKGSQRYRCASCRRTFTETFYTLYYRRQVTPEQESVRARDWDWRSLIKSSLKPTAVP